VVYTALAQGAAISYDMVDCLVKGMDHNCVLDDLSQCIQ
jgi:hypothetical protein